MDTLISRAEAAAAGLRFYFTGRPCRRGHVSKRLVRDAMCHACELARHARYHASHRDRQLARMAANNAARRSEINRAMRDLYASDPAPSQAKCAARRAIKLAAMPPHFGELDRFVLEEAFAAARRRQAATGYRWHVDHMVPLARGGAHAWFNIQVIPAALNRWKGSRMVLTEPLQWVGFLPVACGASPLPSPLPSPSR